MCVYFSALKKETKLRASKIFIPSKLHSRALIFIYIYSNNIHKKIWSSRARNAGAQVPFSRIEQSSPPLPVRVYVCKTGSTSPGRNWKGSSTASLLAVSCSQVRILRVFRKRRCRFLLNLNAFALPSSARGRNWLKLSSGVSGSKNCGILSGFDPVISGNFDLYT